MIVIRCMSGLGNQLFQYALGRHLSLIHGRPLRLDASGYTATEPDANAGTRQFGLDAFAVNGQVAAPEELEEFEIYRRVGTRGRIARLLNRWTPYHRRAVIQEASADYWRFQPSILTSRLAEPVCLVGFWQSERYFADIDATIRRDLTLKQPPDAENIEILSDIERANSIAIHVRHGDNATGAAEKLGVLSSDYYQRAAALIAAEIGEPHFFVFSDDPDWAAKTLMLPGPVTFITHNGDKRNHEDLRLMAACKHHIVANSTFSWWGAWLGKKHGQVVYAPSKYFLHSDQDCPDFYPNSWHLLPVEPGTP